MKNSLSVYLYIAQKIGNKYKKKQKNVDFFGKKQYYKNNIKHII